MFGCFLFIFARHVTLVLLIFHFRHKYMPYNRPNCIIDFYLIVVVLCFVFSFHFAVELWSNQRYYGKLESAKEKIVNNYYRQVLLFTNL